MEKYKSTTDRRMYYVMPYQKGVKAREEALREVAKATKTPVLSFKVMDVWVKGNDMYLEAVRDAEKMMAVVKK